VGLGTGVFTNCNHLNISTQNLKFFTFVTYFSFTWFFLRQIHLCIVALLQYLIISFYVFFCLSSYPYPNLKYLLSFTVTVRPIRWFIMGDELSVNIWHRKFILSLPWMLSLYRLSIPNSKFQSALNSEIFSPLSWHSKFSDFRANWILDF
jgi:hypothetical protein